ncbi:WD40 repeat domain-containing protein [Streptomyces sp. NPDC049040]|uniref:WD40 repeat domain-containing protein n=1 Tax=Streptomyces sp. NPDC049040 TaxID=3365593 RepID=UPI003718AA07
MTTRQAKLVGFLAPGGEDRAAFGTSWSADSRWVATGFADGTVRVFEARTGVERCRIAGSPNVVAFSPDGQWLAMGFDTVRAVVVDAATGAERCRMEHAVGTPEERGTSCLAWNRNGRRLATGADDAALIFNAATGALELAFPSGDTQWYPVRCVAWSPDTPGLRLAVGFGSSAAADTQRGLVTIFDTDGGIVMAQVAMTGVVNSVAWSNSGKYLAAACGDGSAMVVHSTTGTLRTRLLEPLDLDHQVGGAVFSPDDASVALSGADYTVRLFDAASGAERYRVAHGYTAGIAGFSRDGRWLATSSSGIVVDAPPGTEGGGLVFDAATGKKLSLLGFCVSAAFSPDGTLVAAAGGPSDGVTRVFDPFADQERCRLTHGGPVNAVAFSPAGGQVATASQDGTSRVFDAAGGTQGSGQISSGTVTAVACSPLGAIASGGSGGKVRLWDAATGAVLKEMVHGGAVSAVAFSEDGLSLATGSADGKARVFAGDTGEPRFELTHGGEVGTVAFTGDGKWLATGSADTAARIFDAGTGTGHAVLSHAGPVHHVAFSQDGAFLATASADRTARVFDRQTGAQRYQLTHGGSVLSVAVSPAGLLATACDDELVRLFRLADGAELFHWQIGAPVRAVTFSPDGRRLASASAGGTAGLFDPAAGVQILRLDHGLPVNAVAFSPDGQWLATACDDGAARVFTAA